MSQPDRQILENIGRLWVKRWGRSNSDEFADLFTEDGEYLDPAFGVFRRGRDFMKLHHQIWHRAISDFRMTSEGIIAGDAVVVVQAIASGTFNGESLAGGKMAATGKPFHGRMCAVLAVGEGDRIARCTDYYDRGLMPGGLETPMRDLDNNPLGNGQTR